MNRWNVEGEKISMKLTTIKNLWALLFNNAVAIIAALLMVFSRTAKSFEMILLGRFLYGYNNGLLCLFFIWLQCSFSSSSFFIWSLSTGLGLCVHLMYLCESSPQKLRGFLTLTSSIFIGLGKVMGQIIGIK